MQVDVDGISEFNVDFRSDNKQQQSDERWHPFIFRDISTNPSFSGKEVVQRNRLADDQRIETIFLEAHDPSTFMIARRHNVDTSVEATFNINWGDSKGPTYETTFTGSASHDNGAYVEVSVSRDNTGDTNASIDAGIDTKSDK